MHSDVSLTSVACSHSVGFRSVNGSYISFRDNKSGQYQGLSDQGTSQYQGFAEDGVNVGNSYVANEVFQLNQIIDYGEYKNIDHFTKPLGKEKHLQHYRDMGMMSRTEFENE